MTEMGEVAVGVPAWPTVGLGWDWWPLVGVGLSLGIARRRLGLGLTAWVLVGCVAAGFAFGLTVQAWGVVASILVVVGITIVAPGLHRALHRR